LLSGSQIIGRGFDFNQHVLFLPIEEEIRPTRVATPVMLDQIAMSRDNLDENGGGNQSLKRRPVAKS
jgi:hypothetical protein